MVPNFLTSIYTSISSQLNPIDDFKTDMSNEICFNFIRDFGETENQINKDQLERNIIAYPKSMGTSLRALRDETEYAKGICDSDGVYTDLENTIKQIDTFAEDYTSELKWDRNDGLIYANLCLPVVFFSALYASQESTILNWTITLASLALGVYTGLRFMKTNRVYNTFKSAYNEKSE